VRKQLGSSVHSRNAATLDPADLDGLAGDALTYLAAEPERLDRFFAVTGLTVRTLRDAAGTPAFTAHLLDYMASDARRFVAFAEASGRDPAAVEAIRAALTPSRDDG
jgi:hypothetical protein